MIFKFRVWDGGEMHYTDSDESFLQRQDGSTARAGRWEDDLPIEECEGCSPMFSTGLADKDDPSKEWYEGDVLEWRLGNEISRIIVTWDDRYARFGYEYVGSVSAEYAPYPFDHQTLENYHLIGNVFQNPDLFGVSHE